MQVPGEKYEKPSTAQNVGIHCVDEEDRTAMSAPLDVDVGKQRAQTTVEDDPVFR